MIKRLLEAGADVNESNKAGRGQAFQFLDFDT